MTDCDLAYEPVPYAAIDGWAGDDHKAALVAFLKSCGPVLEAARTGQGAGKVKPREAMLALCRAALTLDPARMSAGDARAFFEVNFSPYAVKHGGPEGLLTGYYEPLIEGSRTQEGPYRVPVYRRPPDLVNLVAESQRGAVGQAFTHARKTPDGTEPYATRSEIEEGALAGQGLELVWLKDPVDTFFMHIQGSGRIKLPDGSAIRVTYDGKNGHPYTSIGRYLIDAGLFPANEMSLDALKDWLKADVARGRDAMRQNRSFVFFRELEGEEAESPLGVLHIPLVTGRSLAVDTAFHAIGTPIFVTAPSLTHAGDGNGFRRLMIAHDVGSAIRGPERGDLYFGSGDEAGKLAGVTKHPGRYVVLLPASVASLSSDGGPAS